MIYYTRSAIYHSCRIYEILHQCHIILCLLIVWDIIPNPQYLMAAYFMIYYSKTTISHGCWFHEIYSRTTISHGCLFCDILHQNHNISWLQISWDITPEPQTKANSRDASARRKKAFFGIFPNGNTLSGKKHCQWHYGPINWLCDLKLRIRNLATSWSHVSCATLLPNLHLIQDNLSHELNFFVPLAIFIIIKKVTSNYGACRHNFTLKMFIALATNLAPIWPPGDTTYISSKFHHQMAPIVFIVNLANSH